MLTRTKYPALLQIALAAVGLAGWAPPMIAAGPPPSSAAALADSSLEDLMNVEVTSVSRKKQPLSKSAAAVFVITQSDIARSGATSIPEALRLAPGLMVARISSNKWAIGARGATGRLANKTLVLIDGRSVYTNLYSGVYWEQNDTLIEDVERIEVIRGPGGTMWGANAVTAVINIITKPAKHTSGLMATGGGGNHERGFGSVRYGGQVGDNLHYRAYSKFFNRGALPNDAGGSAEDRWESLRGGARMDWEPTLRDSISVHGDMFRMIGQEGVLKYFPNPYNRQSINTPLWTSGGYAQFRWERTLSDTSDITFQSYFDLQNRDEYIGRAQTRALDFDFQLHRALGHKNDLLWGASYRLLDDWVHAGKISPYAPLTPEISRQSLYSAFAQNDFTIKPDRLILTVGAKLLHNAYTGFEVQPNIRVLWTPTKHHSFWTAVSRAVRTPAREDVNASFVFSAAALGLPPSAMGIALGNPDSRSETLLAYEGGWRWQAGSRATVDVAMFVNNMKDLQTTVFLDKRPQGLPWNFIIAEQFRNAFNQQSGGVEVATTYRISRNVRAHANYSWFRPGSLVLLPGVSLNRPGGNAAPLQGLPYRQHQVQSGVSWDVRRGMYFDSNLYVYSGLSAQNIGPRARLDARFARRLGEGAEWSIGIQDALNDHAPEYVPDDYVSGSNPARSVYTKITWGR